MLSNKKLLITNDDGISENLKALVKELYTYTHDITVIVPAVQMSGVSHARYFGKPCDFIEHDHIYKDVKTYTLSSTPADCVRFGLGTLKINPDYVISGMNDGINMGDDILYSGTCGAIFEAGLMKYKGIAVSCTSRHPESVVNIHQALKFIKENNLDKELLLNINLPINPIGCKITHQGYYEFKTEFLFEDGHYVSHGTPITDFSDQDDESDIKMFHAGYISITPLTTDRTRK